MDGHVKKSQISELNFFVLIVQTNAMYSRHKEGRQEIRNTSMMATPGHVSKLHFLIGLTFIVLENYFEISYGYEFKEIKKTSISLVKMCIIIQIYMT